MRPDVDHMPTDQRASSLPNVIDGVVWLRCVYLKRVNEQRFGAVWRGRNVGPRHRRDGATL